ncbi:MAG: 1-deoxy-D-xylulose-5-phosphate synthase [bacterium]|jgi:1-deoxy-D-xylulose-5-phosphate synthase|nr:1-deoxy-D-xylulose-5-phosphate synthase [bacterium]
MSLILDKITKPADIKLLTFDELQALALELRQTIVSTVAKTGGHIAPSLGAVEISIALHYCLNSPRDKILWDVGHQAYAHKLLTGRADRFHTLRQKGGISGFPKREESPHDILNTGHASTAISAGCGIACARDLTVEDFMVACVVGDGALTGGLAFEGLNHAGHIRMGKFLLVINDNEMSISPNVGALSQHLSRLRTEPLYVTFKKNIEMMLNLVPAIGSRMRNMILQLKDSLKHLIIPGQLFEELGFYYFGPIDGHDIEALIHVFNTAVTLRGPVVVHCSTTKGKGYPPAEKNPSLFHGLGPFKSETGEPLSKAGTPKYNEVFGSTLVELAEEDERIVAVTAAMPDGTGLVKFRDRFPERFFDVGICEQHAVTFAAGLALQGLKPVIAVYSTFLQRAYDQIIHDVALMKLPVVLCLDRAGLVGEDGPTHHGVFDISYLRHIPGLILAAPADETELKDLLATALAWKDGPFAIRYPRGRGPGAVSEEPPQTVAVGTWKRLRSGHDVSLLAVGRMVERALEAACLLEESGISAGVVDARFITPMDMSVLEEVASTVPLVTIEENNLPGGFGSAVLEALNMLRIQTPVLRLGLPDQFIEAGSVEELLQAVGLTAGGMSANVVDFLNVVSKRENQT